MKATPSPLPRKNHVSKTHAYVLGGLLFCFLVYIGIYLRFYDLGKNPAGFFCDEASIGLNAYKILTTGKDEFGVTLPLFYQAFGEYKNPLDLYSTVPFILLFGVNTFAVRFTSFFFGICTLVAVFFYGLLRRNRSFALILLAILATNPWHVHMSRINMEGLSIWVFLVVCVLIFWDLYLQKKRLQFFALSLIFSLLSVYSYFPARVVMPLFAMILSIVAIYRANSTITKNNLLKICALCSLIVIPLAYHMLGENGMSRWNQVSVFNSMSFIQGFSKVLYSYVMHFSPAYLFIQGDIGVNNNLVLRHGIKGIGEFYYWQLIFLYIGAYVVIRGKSARSFPILLLMLLFPIPSSLTTDIMPQATRSVLGIIPITVVISEGIYSVFSILQSKYLSNRILAFVACILTLMWFSISTLVLIKNIQIYPTYSSGFMGWQYGYEQAMKVYMSKYQKSYDELVMTHRSNEPQTLVGFFDIGLRCGVRCRVMENPIKIDARKKQLFAIRMDDILEASLAYPSLHFYPLSEPNTLFGDTSDMYLGYFK